MQEVKQPAVSIEEKNKRMLAIKLLKAHCHQNKKRKEKKKKKEEALIER